MSKLHFEQYEPNEADGLVWEFIMSNQRADLSRIRREYTQAVIGCSDARCEEDAVLPGELLVINTAGNIVEPDQIPKGIEQILVVGHEKSPGVGCGACGLASAMGENADYCSSHGVPDELSRMGQTCIGNTKDNVLNVARKLRESGYEAIALMFNHLSGRLEVIEDVASYSTAMRSLVTKVLEQNSAYQKTYSKETPRGDMEQAQNPYIIGINLISGPTISDLTEQSSKFNGPNTVFEVKPGGKRYTAFAQGSAQYPWHHALTEGDQNFSGTDTTIIAVEDEAQLGDIEGCLVNDPALVHYLAAKEGKKPGRVFGVVVDDKTLKIGKVYELRRVG